MQPLFFYPGKSISPDLFVDFFDYANTLSLNFTGINRQFYEIICFVSWFNNNVCRL